MGSACQPNSSSSCWQSPHKSTTHFRPSLCPLTGHQAPSPFERTRICHPHNKSPCFVLYWPNRLTFSNWSSCTDSRPLNCKKSTSLLRNWTLTRRGTCLWRTWFALWTCIRGSFTETGTSSFWSSPWCIFSKKITHLLEQEGYSAIAQLKLSMSIGWAMSSCGRCLLPIMSESIVGKWKIEEHWY